MFENAREDIRRSVACKRPSSRQHLEEDAPERPDVGPLVHLVPTRLFRAHIRRGSDNPPFGTPIERAGGMLGSRVGTEKHDRFCQSEIEHLGSEIAAGRPGGPRVLQDDVGRFQIAMDDSFCVRGLECFGDLACDGERFGNSHCPLVQAICERRSFDQFEY